MLQLGLSCNSVVMNPILWILAQESLPQLNGPLWSSLKGMTAGRKEEPPMISSTLMSREIVEALVWL